MEGDRVAILGYGTIVQQCVEAAGFLQSQNIYVTVVDARFCKPLDADLITRLATEHEILITAEEGSVGGFGSHVAHFLSLKGLLDGPLKVNYLKQKINKFKPNWCFLLFLSSLTDNFFPVCFLQLRSMFLPDRYIDHGSPQDQIEEAGLSSTHICATVLSLLGKPKQALNFK